MNGYWNRLSVGKKIASGFGVVLVLFCGVMFVSNSGLNTIVRHAERLIEVNQLDVLITRAELDHLNWSNKINAFLTDETATKLDIVEQPGECPFGKWLQSTSRKESENQIPMLSNHTQAADEPHQKFHQSITNIRRQFQRADIKLPSIFSDMEMHLLEFITQLNEVFTKNNSVFAVISDEFNCAIGKWLFSDASSKTASENEKMTGLSGVLKDSHHNLHESYTKIKAAYAYTDVNFNISLTKGMQEHEKWFAAIVMAIIEDADELGTYTDHDRCPVHTLLRSEQTEIIIMNCPQLKEPVEGVKETIGKVFSFAGEINKMLQQGNIVRAKHIFINNLVPANTHLKMHVDQVIEIQNTLLRQDNVKKIYENEAMPAYKQTRSAIKSLKAEAEQMLENAKEAKRIYAAETLPSLELFKDSLEKSSKEINRHIETNNNILNTVRAVKRNVIGLGSAVIIILIVSVFVITRGITKVLKMITEKMNYSAIQVTQAANEASSASHQISDAASNQAASLQETSSSMEVIDTMAKQNAENARQAAQVMEEVLHVTETARQSVDELKQSMNDIAAASNETHKIIKTIDDIAFQTNLLALNASIEAARVGEAGSGFAVVAGEVRTLAFRSAEAVKSTSSMIEGTIEKIKNGSALMNKADKAVHEVVSGIEKVRGQIHEINNASVEQTHGIDQISKAIADLDRVTQQNLVKVEQTASISKDMESQAKEMEKNAAVLVQLTGGSHYL